MPVSFVVQDDVEIVQVSLAMRAGLDLVRSGLYSIASLGIRKQADVSDNLPDLGEFESSLDGKVGVGIIDMATLYKDATVRQLIAQSIFERPLGFFNIASFSRTVSKFCIRPASESVEFVSLNPPANAYEVKMRRPGPSVFFPAFMTATMRTVQMYLSPRVQYEYSTVSAAVFLQEFPGLLIGSVQAFLA